MTNMSEEVYSRIYLFDFTNSKYPDTTFEITITDKDFRIAAKANERLNLIDYFNYSKQDIENCLDFYGLDGLITALSKKTIWFFSYVFGTHVTKNKIWKIFPKCISRLKIITKYPNGVTREFISTR